MILVSVPHEKIQTNLIKYYLVFMRYKSSGTPKGKNTCTAWTLMSSGSSTGNSCTASVPLVPLVLHKHENTMIILDLDYPPSANTYWRHARGRHYIGEKGLAFRAKVAELVAMHKLKADAGRLELSVMLYPPDRRRRDIDNVCKALLDSLTFAGLIEDDSLIDRLLIERGAVVKGGKCRIYLQPYTIPNDIR